MNLNQVTVPSLNIAKAIDFYQTLGLKLIVRALPHYARFECPGGDSTFSVHEVSELPEKEGIVVYFECNNLDAYVKKLQADGITFDSQPEDKAWLWREARLKDPDQNLLVLYFAGKNRKSPPWRINS